jgi:hypothetical protein
MTFDEPVSRKTTGTAVHVHRKSNGREQSWGLLDFVDDDGTAKVQDKPGRVAGSECKCGVDIKGLVLGVGPGSNRMGQRCFAGLASAIEQHDWGIGHGQVYGIMYMAANLGQRRASLW